MDLRLWRYELPLKRPVSLKPGLTMGVREGLLLETVEDGESSWGEAAPLPGFSRESLGDARRRLEEVMEELSRAESPSREAAASLPSGSPSAGFALGAVFAGPRLGAPDGSLALCGLLSGGREEVLSGAGRMRDAGYAAVKLKVGRGSVEGDADLVREVRSVLGDGVSLRLDANRAWSFEEAARFARLVAEAGIEFIEEPLEGAGRLRELAETTGLPVALDESLAEMDPGGAEAHDYARAFVLKPTVIGARRTSSFAAAAKAIGAAAVISSSYESGVGTMCLIRLAAELGDGAAGLDTYRRFAEDVISPALDLVGPRVNLKEFFSVRREVDHEKLERIS